MAKNVFKNAKLFADGRDIGGLTNAVTLSFSADAKETTDIEAESISRLSGIESSSVEISGFSDASTEDEAHFNRLGGAKVPVTLAPINGAAVGERAFFLEAPQFTYNVTGQVGEVFTFEGSFGGASRLVRGVVEDLSIATAKTASGSSAGNQLGAVTADQTLFAVLQVVESDGDGSQTLDVVIQSDDNAGFTSATTRITFAQVTTTTAAEMKSVAGAITDDYFRANFTIAGTGSPSFKLILAFGIKV